MPRIQMRIVPVGTAALLSATCAFVGSVEARTPLGGLA
jgi:hypothetical protein